MTTPLRKLALLAISFLTCCTAIAQDVMINEVDADQPGADPAEFIELYGAPGTSLDGLVLVCFNGLDDAPYLEFDLSGYALNASGFFVVGSMNVPNVDLEMGTNALQNGPEAIALYAAAPGSITGVVTGASLLDALVYGTNDSDDPELLALLNPGQPQVNESAGAGSGSDSMSRVPNGGTPRNTDTYVPQLPTPGASNVQSCDGGTVFEVGDADPIEICSDAPAETYTFDYTSSTADADYLFVVTDAAGEIAFTSGDPMLSFESLPDGECRIYGVSYIGTLVAETLAAGQLLENIASDDCASVSTNHVTVLKSNCTPATCSAGAIAAVGFGDEVAMCLSGGTQALEFSFEATPGEGGMVAYVLTDDAGAILELFFDPSYDFSGLGEGAYHVHGVVYSGSLFEGTVEVGDPISGVDSDGDCTEQGTNFVAVNRLDCVAGLGCDELFISEYCEGSANNKALELINPTDVPIDLAPYTLHVYNNGATEPSNTYDLTGTIGAGETYVVVSPDADPAWQAYADALSQVTWFSGNDPVALLKNGVYIDIMGELGYDSTTPIAVTGGSMELHTLRRKLEVTSPTTDWTVGQGQWDVYDANVIDGLGSHLWVPCDNNNEPQVTFETTTTTVTEGEAVVISVSATNVSVSIDVVVELEGGTATAGEDFLNPLPVSLTFNPGGAPLQNVVFLSTDDELEEETETVLLSLSTATENVNVAIEEHTVNIVDNDQPVPVYIIQEVTQNDTEGVADSLGVYCELRGLVYGQNLRPEGLQFTLADNKDGIGVFSLEQQFDYTVQERDSIHVIGTIDQFNGLTQIIPDTVIFIQSDLVLEVPVPIEAPIEDRESELNAMSCVWLVDPAQWTNELPGFNVEITNGETVSEMRIDADVDLFGGEPIEGVFDLVGIGGQFDSSEPYDQGYQILPRYSEDVTPLFDADFTIDNPLNTVSLQITEADTCLTPSMAELWQPVWQAVGDDADYTWTVNGDVLSTTSTLDALPTGWSIGEDLEVTLAATVDGCTYLITHTYCSQWADFVPENTFEVTVFPNPAPETVRLTSDRTLDRVDVFTADGRWVEQHALRGVNATLPTAHWTPGSYVLVIHAGDRTTRVRILR